MSDRISVIVPVYNVEAYLPQCLDSITAQDHKDLEIILIDDGSTDSSGAICDAYAEKDSRIRVIHQKNGGAAAAKNAGLRIASGEYLAFADSDDFLERDAYSYMLSALRQTGADAGEFSFRYVYVGREEDQCLYPERTVLTAEEYMPGYTKGWHHALLWNKLYRRSLFEGILFEEGHRIDDEFFTYQGMMNARRIVCDGKVIYNYRLRRSGAMLNPQAGQQRMLDRLDYMDQRRRKVAARFPGLKHLFDTEYLDALVYFTEYPENTLVSMGAIKKQAGKYFREKGNTLPPRHLWRGLLRVALTPAEKLLACIPVAEPDVDPEDCFA